MATRGQGIRVARLDARDRALFQRAALAPHERWGLRGWRLLTHLGGTTTTVAACTVPHLMGGEPDAAAGLAAKTLVLSHALVQLVKRTVGRPRPSLGLSWATLVPDPDRFSFPSGHSAAAMSVAFGYAAVFPQMAVPMIAVATVVGISRVRLGAHYPGDVLMGQLLAIITGMLIRKAM